MYVLVRYDTSLFFPSPFAGSLLTTGSSGLCLRSRCDGWWRGGLFRNILWFRFRPVLSRWLVEEVYEERRHTSAHHIHQPLGNPNQVTVDCCQNQCKVIKDPFSVMRVSSWKIHVLEVMPTCLPQGHRRIPKALCGATPLP